MKNKVILVLGAGRSSSALINYLLQAALTNQWQIMVGDVSIQAAQERIGNHSCGKALQFDISQTEESRLVVAMADLVVSLIPANLHPLVAKLCLLEGKHLLTASYVSDEMNALHQDAQKKDILFLNECGLDPGIDHMSAMQVIDRIKNDGGKLLSFESFTGGLIAPTTDIENPWRYKFTWNPRNVVMAGHGTAKFLHEGNYKYIPYHQLFKRITEVSVPGFGEFEGYANRDSLKYLNTYGLGDIKTMVRGTLRNRGYCSAWNVLVQLGCCDDTYQLENVSDLTHRDFIGLFLTVGNKKLEDVICNQFSLDANGEEMKRLSWSGFFSDEKVGLTSGSPAQVLEHILQKKWKLNSGDQDFIVMWHRFGFFMNGEKKEIQAYLTCTGDDAINTAMAKTVGLPLAIATKLLAQNKIKSRGVAIPVTSEFYEPILKELSDFNVHLVEQEEIVSS
jgi:saccharopine dehydrogenase-like NADP-dependent oxidoreductase